MTPTPKEKAKQLIDSFKKYAHSNPLHDSELFYRRLRENAKECALIAVDEMLSLGSLVGNSLSDTFYIFWQEVKQEIEKL